jgi:hypothetical protein
MTYTGERFELKASPDSSSFVLLSKADSFIAHLEGAEAVRFEADYNALRRQRPDLDPDQTLGKLWNDCGYSWCAAQYAD